MKKTLFLSLLFGAVLAAQTKPAEPKVPTVPIEHQNEYNRADAAVAKAKPVWDKMTADLQAASIVIQKDCGDKFSVRESGKELVCVANPEVPKEVPKSPAK